MFDSRINNPYPRSLNKPVLFSGPKAAANPKNAGHNRIEKNFRDRKIDYVRNLERQLARHARGKDGKRNGVSLVSKLRAQLRYNPTGFNSIDDLEKIRKASKSPELEILKRGSEAEQFIKHKAEAASPTPSNASSVLALNDELSSSSAGEGEKPSKRKRNRRKSTVKEEILSSPEPDFFKKRSKTSQAAPPKPFSIQQAKSNRSSPGLLSESELWGGDMFSLPAPSDAKPPSFSPATILDNSSYMMYPAAAPSRTVNTSVYINSTSHLMDGGMPMPSVGVSSMTQVASQDYARAQFLAAQRLQQANAGSNSPAFFPETATAAQAMYRQHPGQQTRLTYANPHGSFGTPQASNDMTAMQQLPAQQNRQPVASFYSPSGMTFANKPDILDSSQAQLLAHQQRNRTMPSRAISTATPTSQAFPQQDFLSKDWSSFEKPFQ